MTKKLSGPFFLIKNTYRRFRKHRYVLFFQKKKKSKQQFFLLKYTYRRSCVQKRRYVCAGKKAGSARQILRRFLENAGRHAISGVFDENAGRCTLESAVFFVVKIEI